MIFIKIILYLICLIVALIKLTTDIVEKDGNYNKIIRKDVWFPFSAFQGFNARIALADKR